MILVIFTLDYEIHGNGDGSPFNLMIEPTNRMLKFFDRYGAKLTILADVAEILKFKEYYEKTGNDDYYFEKIKKQLQQALKGGHDVQLHVHSSYFKAEYKNNKWNQCWNEYDLARLNIQRLDELIKNSKSFLEDILVPVKPDYKCSVFRAANWSMHPSKNIIKALIDNRINIDTSVFKYGHRKGIVNFDYRNAYSEIIPWPVNKNDICKFDSNGELIEIPIYCEKQTIFRFLTINRIYRAFLSQRHKLRNSKENVNLPENSIRRNSSFLKRLSSKLTMIFKKHAWKMDFNQCTGRQLIKGLLNVERKYKNFPLDLPFVLIGHSKIFTGANQKSLEAFLSFVKNHKDRFAFGLFSDIDIEGIGKGKYRKESI